MYIFSNNSSKPIDAVSVYRKATHCLGDIDDVLLASFCLQKLIHQVSDNAGFIGVSQLDVKVILAPYTKPSH